MLAILQETRKRRYHFQLRRTQLVKFGYAGSKWQSIPSWGKGLLKTSEMGEHRRYLRECSFT